MSERDTYIYIFATVVGGKPSAPVKVGISKSPGSRLATIQTACPNEICMYYFSSPVRRRLAEGIEYLFHTVMADSRLKGEWFSLEPEDARAAFQGRVRAWVTQATEEELEPFVARAGL